MLATNRPGDLDPAVLDRMDEALEFPLPGPAERATILQLYIDSYIAKAGTAEGVCTGSPQFCPAWIRPASSLTSQRQTGLQWSCIAASRQVGGLIGLNATKLSPSLTCPGGAGARAEAGIVGRLRALLRGRTGRPDAIKVAGISPELIQEAAEATDGFSGRELAKLVASMQASTALYLSP